MQLKSALQNTHQESRTLQCFSNQSSNQLPGTALRCARARTTMSLEDLSSLTQSDESDGEAERLWSDGEYDDGGEARYFDLVLLHGELTNFENIYCNNDIIDMEVRLF